MSADKAAAEPCSGAAAEPYSGAAVECYSGHTFAQEPRVVIWEGRRYGVEEVAQRWRTPEGPGFRVLTSQGMSFDIHYSEQEDRWTVRPRAPGASPDGSPQLP